MYYAEHDRELLSRPLMDLSALIFSKQISPIELTEAVFRRIAIVDPTIHCFVTTCEEQAYEQAQNATHAITRGEFWGPLHGIPVAIKDLYDTKGVRTTYGSLVYKDHIPDSDGLLADRLKRAGAILVGKTNTPEFGSSFATQSRVTDECRNPWNTLMSSGGSSGGAAAAVAAGVCPICPGSDGGGSIRVPASLCGVFGHKPTYGRIPYDVHPRFGAGLDFICHGPITRYVEDAAFLMAALSGPDRRDYASIETSPADYQSLIEQPLRKLKVVWSPDLGYASTHQEVLSTVQQTVETIADLGHIVEEHTVTFAAPYCTWEELASAANSLLYCNLLEKHAENLTSYFRRSLEIGERLRGTDIIADWMEVVQWRGRLRHLFGDYDILITPTVAVAGFPLGATQGSFGHGMMNWEVAPLTALFNFTHHPAASVPCGFGANGVPIGMQIVGRLNDDATVLQLAKAIQTAQPWHQTLPSV